MPTLNWIGKDAVVNHHLQVPFHLLADVPELACGEPGSGNLIVQGDNLVDRLQGGAYDGWLKIAVWHHSVAGKEMMNDEFMQLLAVHGFQVCLHGHIHEAIEGFHKYDDRRGIRIIGTGTFGAPISSQAGIPLQYNLLTFDPETGEMTVQTRKKEKPNGAWSADARWGDKNDPKAWYRFRVPNYRPRK